MLAVLWEFPGPRTHAHGGPSSRRSGESACSSCSSRRGAAWLAAAAACLRGRRPGPGGAGGCGARSWERCREPAELSWFPASRTRAECWGGAPPPTALLFGLKERGKKKKKGKMLVLFWLGSWSHKECRVDHSSGYPLASHGVTLCSSPLLSSLLSSPPQSTTQTAEPAAGALLEGEFVPRVQGAEGSWEPELAQVALGHHCSLSACAASPEGHGFGFGGEICLQVKPPKGRGPDVGYSRFFPS